MHLKYLITGTGRCGTVYMARLLTSLGINCGHEAIYGPPFPINVKEKINNTLETSRCSDIDNWFNPENVQAESSYMSAPYLDDPFLRDTKIIHVVRNPLKVISSFVCDLKFFNFLNLSNEIYKKFVFDLLPGLHSIENEIEKACYYYVQWNKMIELKSKNHQYFFHKVENGCNKELFDFLEIEPTTDFFSNTKINSWDQRERDLTYSKIPDGPIKNQFIEISKRYKYFILF